ncbi:hypothetical protein [Cellulomonas endophytica]|uniref:hypothetical protein n=1 Tax=Cellulomonas endophytica TaxID=2494735 RepID=UPI0010107F06|nr:hypothetical protein [Cellulomonas endophytica]
MTAATLLVVLACLALAGWAALFVARDRAVVLRQLVGGGVVEGLLVLQALVLAVLAVRGDGPVAAPWEAWGYVLTQLLVLPVAAAWAFAERTRWSSVVLLVAALTVAFLQYRVLVLWGGA